MSHYANLIKKYSITQISLSLSNPDYNFHHSLITVPFQVSSSSVRSFHPQPDSTFPGHSSSNISLPIPRGNNNNNARRGLAMAATGGRDAAKAGRKGPRSADRGSRSHKFVLIASDVTFCFNYAALSGR